MKYGAIILAGGKSSRMGQDKGLIRFENKYFVEYSIEALQSSAEDLSIVSSNEKYDRFNCNRVEDEIPGLGPLGGLQKGLRCSNYDKNVVLSSDIPFITNSIIERLIIESGGSLIAVAKCGDRVHPLIGIYSKQVLFELDQFLASGGRSVMKFISRFETQFIEFDLSVAHCFVNVNTKEEFEALKS